MVTGTPSMRRPLLNSRHRGLLLICLVLLTAAVIPNLSSRTVAGFAQAAPPAGPPAVGDCVTHPIDPNWDNFGVRPASTGITDGTYVYPQVGISPCQAGRDGEITALLTDPVKPVVTTIGAGLSSTTDVADSNIDTCQWTAYRYVGIALTGDQVAPLVAGWYPQLMIGVAASTPSIRQQAAGQHWLACILYLRALADTNPVADQQRYTKSLRNALFTGQEGNRTGLCVAGADLNEGESGLIGCSSGHRSEIFGLGGTGEHRMARTDLQRSCQQVVARLTGHADIPGALRVQVLATDPDQTPITGASIPANTSLSCGISSTGPRILVGSLLAIANKPIPWK